MKDYLNLGTGLIGTNIMVGSIPNITGSATETGLKANFATGVSKVGTALPVYGKVKGTQLVIKSVKKLKPIKFRGGIIL